MNRKTRRTSDSVRYMTRGALVAALYVGLCYVSTIFGLSSGAIQFRIAEALCILPVFLPEAIPGLFIGCILSNIIDEQAGDCLRHKQWQDAQHLGYTELYSSAREPKYSRYVA